MEAYAVHMLQNKNFSGIDMSNGCLNIDGQREFQNGNVKQKIKPGRPTLEGKTYLHKNGDGREGTTRR